jgi:hypothetical protein
MASSVCVPDSPTYSDGNHDAAFAATPEHVENIPAEPVEVRTKKALVAKVVIAVPVCVSTVL